MRTAVIATVFALAPLGAQAANLSGAWQIDATAGTTPIVIDCTLLQKGRKLSGHCAPRSEGATPVDFTGIVKGSKASWGYDVVFRDRPGTVAFEADIKSSKAMTGTLKLNGKPSAFSAAKL